MSIAGSYFFVVAMRDPVLNCELELSIHHGEAAES
jgi:hypothetical protein